MVEREEFKSIMKNSDTKIQMAFSQIENLNEHLQSTILLLTQYLKSLVESDGVESANHIMNKKLNMLNQA